MALSGLRTQRSSNKNLPLTRCQTSSWTRRASDKRGRCQSRLLPPPQTFSSSSWCPRGRPPPPSPPPPPSAGCGRKQSTQYLLECAFQEGGILSRIRREPPFSVSSCLDPFPFVLESKLTSFPGWSRYLYPQFETFRSVSPRSLYVGHTSQAPYRSNSCLIPNPLSVMDVSFSFRLWS